jgi:DNA-binding Xre family transcriptional regulator
MSTLHKQKIAKISKDELVSMKVIDDICEVLNCEVDEVIVHIKKPVNKLTGFNLLSNIH